MFLYTSKVLISDVFSWRRAGVSRLLVGEEGGLYMEREAKVLSGLVEHVLPRVGSHTLSLDLAHGKAVSNAVVSHFIQLGANLGFPC